MTRTRKDQEILLLSPDLAIRFPPPHGHHSELPFAPGMATSYRSLSTRDRELTINQRHVSRVARVGDPQLH